MNFNLIDLAIIAVLAIFALIGWYRGFLSSLLHSISTFASLLVSGIGYRQFARFLDNKFNALELTLKFTDVGEAIGDVELSRVVVSTASESQLATALEACNLPGFISKLIEKNVSNAAFSDIGLATIEEYFNRTLAITVLHVISYVALFILAFVFFELVVSMFLALVRLPVLRQFDSLAGAIVTVVIGLIVVRVIFMLVPTGLSLMSIEQIRAWFTESAIGSMFYNSKFILRGIKGTMLR